MREEVPETPRQVREVLARRGLTANRRRGQNFLTDRGVRDAIVRDAGVRPGDLVFEVGPGLGTLTKGLLQAGAAVIAVELDRGLSDFLEVAFAGEARLTLLRGDVLCRGEIAPSVRQVVLGERPRHERALVVSNLPYSCATPFLAAVAREVDPFDAVTAMVQLEVARRLIASPGTPDYGPLAVLFTLTGHAQIVREVGGTVFTPTTRIRSGVVSFLPVATEPAAVRAGDWAARTAFLHRRKSLRKSFIASGIDPAAAESAIRGAGAEPGDRAERLSAKQFVSIGLALAPENPDNRLAPGRIVR